MKNKLGKVLRAMLLTLTIVLMYSMNVSAASGQASIGSKNYADSTECTVSGTEWSDNQTESGCYTEENTVLQEKRKVHV